MAEGSLTHRGHDVEAKAPYQHNDVDESKESGELEPGVDEHGVWGGQDYHDMMRLGKKQEFKRNFSLISALGFVSVSLSVGLANGGFAGLFWCFITTGRTTTAIEV
ncbi:hypothetical protein LTR10_013873 [Elasticomyces elasticus]|nr:hypothetical protein LTR10_013873 [Elasticomyces elasticus]